MSIIEKIWKEPQILKHRDIIKSIISDEIPIPIPIHVEIEATERCNHACCFCHCHTIKDSVYKNTNFDGKKIFPTSRLISLIDELKDIGTKAISFTGAGEPLLHPDIFKVFEKIIESGIEFGVTTNLSKDLSDSEIDILSKASWIRCSIDAGTNSIYKKVHGTNNSIEVPLRNIKRIYNNKDRNCLINISFVVCDENKYDILEATLLSKKLGANSISFRPNYDYNRRSYHNKYDNLIMSQLREAKQEEIDIFKVDEGHKRLTELDKLNDSTLCYYSNHVPFIKADGGVYPCCITEYIKGYCYGNIMNMDFRKFWESEDRRNNYKKINMKNCPPCRHNINNKILSLLYSKDDLNYFL